MRWNTAHVYLPRPFPPECCCHGVLCGKALAVLAGPSWLLIYALGIIMFCLVQCSSQSSRGRTARGWSNEDNRLHRKLRLGSPLQGGGEELLTSGVHFIYTFSRLRSRDTLCSASSVSLACVPAVLGELGAPLTLLLSDPHV